MHGGVVYQQLFIALPAGVRHGDGGQQAAGVGMDGVGHQLLRVGQFHDAALVDDCDPVRNVAHHREIMGDEQVGDAALLLQAAQQVEHLVADGHVQSADGLIGHDEFRLHDQRTGNADTLALADAVQVAIDFAKEHADETLILVTGDHETGGLTIGFAGTDYDTYLDSLANQTISYAQFDEQYVAAYKENGTSFEDAMKDVEKLFGLKLSGEETDRLVLTDYEVQRLRTAFDLAMSDTSSDDYTQEQYVLYGTYNPFSVTVTHILNNKSGVDFTSYSHTGLPVAVFADGNGADVFTGYYDNTEIYQKMASLVGVQ